MEKIHRRDPGSRMNIKRLKILKFFDAESCQSWIRDRKSRIRDEHLGSATLPERDFFPSVLFRLGRVCYIQSPHSNSQFGNAKHQSSLQRGRRLGSLKSPLRSPFKLRFWKKEHMD